MSTVTASVTPGYTFTYDADLKIWITRDRLNLLGNPTVQVNLSGKVNSDGDDVVAATIDEEMLATTVRARLVTATATVAAESSNNVDVSIQFKDANGDNLAAKTLCHAWISTAAAGAPTTLPSGGAPTIPNSNGVIVQAMTATAPGIYMSSAAGLLELRFTEAGALTRYLNLIVQSRLVAGSGAMVWT